MLCGCDHSFLVSLLLPSGPHGLCEVLVQCPPQQHLYRLTSALGAKNSSNLGAFEITSKSVSGSSDTKSGIGNMRLMWRPLSAKDVKLTFIAQSMVGDLFIADALIKL